MGGDEDRTELRLYKVKNRYISSTGIKFRDSDGWARVVILECSEIVKTSRFEKKTKKKKRNDVHVVRRCFSLPTFSKFVISSNTMYLENFSQR